ncbi:hypothetical protein [Alkalicoccus chagannorensis]|uniref:hypothetical protein n=1 Tax=Alkalicoccus chagannorensis TaxID=427072 RepID=UPI0003F8E7F8|nr:hypothetical protein [Alkalicoccus chagannorensis]
MTCPECQSDSTLTVSLGRYVFVTSTLPLLLTIILAVWISPVLLWFIPPLFATNYLIGRKRAPMVVCRNCRRTSHRVSAA